MKRKLLVLLLLLTPLLAACHMNFGMSPKPGSSQTSNSSTVQPSSTASTSAKPTPTITATPTPIKTVKPIAPSPFAGGAVTRLLTAGSAKLVVKYWTKQDPETWKFSDPVQVQLSAHMEDADDIHEIQVTNFHAVLVCGSDSLVLRDDTGQFVITPPYSYGSAITVQCPHPGDTARLDTEFDLAVQTTPQDETYFRQTVLDSFAVTFPGDAHV